MIQAGRKNSAGMRREAYGALLRRVGCGTAKAAPCALPLQLRCGTQKPLASRALARSCCCHAAGDGACGCCRLRRLLPPPRQHVQQLATCAPACAVAAFAPVAAPPLDPNQAPRCAPGPAAAGPAHVGATAAAPRLQGWQQSGRGAMSKKGARARATLLQGVASSLLSLALPPPAPHLVPAGALPACPHPPPAAPGFALSCAPPCTPGPQCSLPAPPRLSSHTRTCARPRAAYEDPQREEHDAHKPSACRCAVGAGAYREGGGGGGGKVRAGMRQICRAGRWKGRPRQPRPGGEADRAGQ